MTDEETRQPQENGMLFDEAVKLARDIEATPLWKVQRLYRYPHNDDVHLWHIVASFGPDGGARGIAKPTYIHNAAHWLHYRKRADDWLAAHPKGRKLYHEKRKESPPTTGIEIDQT